MDKFIAWYKKHWIIYSIIAFLFLVLVFGEDKKPVQTTTDTGSGAVAVVEENKPSFKENCDKIKNGATYDNVISILGEPDRSSESEISGIGKSNYLIYSNGFSMESCQISIMKGKVSSKTYTK